MASMSEERWFDATRALAAAGGDRAILCEIAELFLDDVPRRIGALHEALATNDLAAIASLAHSLRGSAAIFGAEALVQSTLRLELLARERRPEPLPSAMARVEFSLGKLVVALTDLVKQFKQATER